jgi:hypothetical protein
LAAEHPPCPPSWLREEFEVLLHRRGEQRSHLERQYGQDHWTSLVSWPAVVGDILRSQFSSFDSYASSTFIHVMDNG